MFLTETTNSQRTQHASYSQTQDKLDDFLLSLYCNQLPISHNYEPTSWRTAEIDRNHSRRAKI